MKRSCKMQPSERKVGCALQLGCELKENNLANRLGLKYLIPQAPTEIPMH
jgi:hypothetical protein